MRLAKTIESIKGLNLYYGTGLPYTRYQALLQQIHEAKPNLFDHNMSEFIENGKRYILFRHYDVGYRKEK